MNNQNYTATEVMARQAVFDSKLIKLRRRYWVKFNKSLAKSTLRILTNYGSITSAVCLRLKLK